MSKAPKELHYNGRSIPQRRCPRSINLEYRKIDWDATIENEVSIDYIASYLEGVSRNSKKKDVFAKFAISCADCITGITKRPDAGSNLKCRADTYSQGYDKKCHVFDI